MNSNFSSNFITVSVIGPNITSGVVVCRLYKLHNPFLYAKFSHGPLNDFSCYLIECFFKVNKSEVQFHVLSQMFFLQLRMNIASVEPWPGTKPNYMSSMNTLSLMIFSITLSIPLMTSSRSLRPLQLLLIRASPFPL